MSATRRRARSARAAEPSGIGSARARDPLALEVRLLGALLGQVITEQAGEAIYDLVERLRLAAIAFRHDEQPEVRERLEAELDALELEDAEAVITAFSLYFQLVNLAEARARVRALRRRERTARDGLLDDSVAEAVARLRRAGRTDADLDADHGAAADHAGAHRPPDRSASSHDARRASTLRRPPRTARRHAADALGRSRDPSAAARGDHAPVADVGPAGRVAGAARRGPHGDGHLRRHAVHAGAAAVPGGRRSARPRSRALGRRGSRRSSASARGSAATATATRRSPPT